MVERAATECRSIHATGAPCGPTADADRRTSWIPSSSRSGAAPGSWRISPPRRPATSPADDGRRLEVHLIEDLGADVAPELPELAAAIAAAVLAEDAIIDGVISRQVGLSGVGAAPITEMRHRPALIRRDRTDLDVVPRGAAAEQDGDIDGLIALDLLRVDGVSLLDVPLLERKRLLESVVQPGPLVRTSTHVRPPIDSWIATWKSLGLRGGILKAANSRYLPGTETVEWRLVERLGR